MKTVEINNKKYNLLEDYREAFVLEEVEEKLTDYFDEYEYIVGDWSYGKVRIKGFYDKNNKKSNAINSFGNKEKYLKEMCPFDCRYFVLQKIK